MRLERLELAGFGRLHHVDIDFAPRLTVIQGGNETGKSTVVRAIRAALYGLDAGGQGRAVERSEWSRWMPWSTGQYGLVLTWSLAGGRRFRIARRFDQRDSSAQVQELGGGDVTAAMRIGRTVAPGHVQLGVDEVVFGATAWLGDEGLRPPPDAAVRRLMTARLQEAIERLADTGRGVTAQEAIARLRDAAARIGSERRLGTPLGMAAARLRTLDHELREAERRAAAVASDQTRLTRLEAAACVARERSLDCERSWLRGRLARIAADRSDIAATLSELRHLEVELTATAHCSDFPLHDEATVIALGGEMQQAAAAATEARTLADAAAPRLEAVHRRRAEIAEGLAALGPPPPAEDQHESEMTELEHELSAESAVGRRRDEARRNESYSDQLRRQIAATGLGAVPAGAVEVLTPVFERALAPPRRPLQAAVAAALAVIAVSAVIGAGAGATAATVAAMVAGAIGTAAVTGLVLRDDGARARRELSRQCPGLDTSPEGLEIAASRLPTLRRLQEELQRCQVLVESDRVEIEAARTRSAALAERAEAVAAGIGVLPGEEVRVAAEPHGVDHHGMRTRAALDAVRGAIDRRRCHDRLSAEDAHLAQEEEDLSAVLREASRRRVRAEAVEDRLQALLEPALGGAVGEWQESVSRYREACEVRRRHDAATARNVQLHRRLEAFGADETILARRDAEFSAELVARGGDPDEARTSEVPAGSALDALERQAEWARRAAAAAGAEAATLRARLAGMQENLPCIADLADERTSCAAARERSLRQLAAIDLAVERITAATRDVHRELAPGLASSVGQRLSTITEGRYSAVNVDTEHFDVGLLGPERPEVVPLELASRGTRDQVSLLLRLALAEHLSHSGEPVPLILDEPLLSADRARTENALEFLCRLSEHHQVVMTSSDAEVAGFVCDRLGEECAVALLPPIAREHRAQEGRGAGQLAHPAPVTWTPS